MTHQWTTFEGRQHIAGGRKEPRVTINSRNVFYLNGKAFEALGQHAAVELLYDGNQRIIGIRPVDPHKRNAFRVKKQGASGGYMRISASAFCQHFRLKFDRTVLFDSIDLTDDGTLLLDLTRTVNVGRGAR